MDSPETVVRSFFAATAEPGNFADAMRTYFAPDADWRNTGFPDAVGIDAILGLVQAFVDGIGLDAMRVDLVELAVSGEAVLTERVDSLLNAQGETISEFIVSGTLVVRDGKIVSWRDYWDPRPLLPPS